jgi:hypothetical protein
MECFHLSKNTIKSSLDKVHASFKDYEVMEKAKVFVQEQLKEPPVVVLENSGVFGNTRTYIARGLIQSLHQSTIDNERWEASETGDNNFVSLCRRN